MDANGVLGSMCFPSFPNLCGQLFARSKDKDVGARDPQGVQRLARRRVVRHLPRPLHPADARRRSGTRRRWPPRCAALAAKGCHAVSFSENPEKLKLPELPQRRTGTRSGRRASTRARSCACTSARRRRSSITAPDAPIDVLITLQPMNIVQAAADLMWSPVLRKFPDLRVALSEGGIGWIPYFLERLDWIYTRHHLWTGQDFGGRLPSDVFRERIVTCFIDDPAGVAIRDRVGIDSHLLGGRLPALRLDVADVARVPDEVARRRARRRHRQDHAPQRHAPLPLRPVRRTDPRASAPSARCGPRPPTSTSPRAPAAAAAPARR